MVQPKNRRLLTEAAGDVLAKRIGVNPRGAWAASTAYAQGDTVTSAGASYRALVDHTSTSTAPSAGSTWQLIAAAGLKGADSTVPGPDGKSAYQIARDGGYGGTQTQWLASLKGADSTVPGPAGQSAYAAAQAAGFAGTQAQWIASLKGDPGAASTVPGPAGRGFTPRGAWAASTAYAVDDLVTADGSTFRVTTAHTSGSTAPTATTPGSNLALWASRGAAGAAGTLIVEVSQTAYDALTATQKAASYYAIVADNNLAADTQALLNAGNLDRFALRGTGGALSATTVDGIGAVMVTATSSSASRDLGVGSTVAVTTGRSYRIAATLRHHVKWDASMRVDVIWRTSADATISTVVGTETSVPAVGSDVVLTQSSVGPAPSNAASMEVRVRGASNTVAPSLNGAISVRNVTVVAL